MATTKSLDYIRSEFRRRARERTYGESAVTGELPNGAEWEEILGHIDAAIDRLPDQTRHAVLAHFLGRKPHGEIAAEMKVSRRAVSYRIERGLASIRRDLRERGLYATTALIGTSLTAEGFAAPLSLKASLGKLTIAAATTGGGGNMTVATKLLGSLLMMKKILFVTAVFTLAVAGVYVSSLRPETRAGFRTSGALPASPDSGRVDLDSRLGEETQPADAVRDDVAAIDDTTASSLEELIALSWSEQARDLENYPAIGDPTNHGSISGVVLDSDGYPVRNATISAVPAENWGELPRADTMAYSAMSSPDGTYTLEGIRHAGEYWVNANKPEFETVARGQRKGEPIAVGPGMNAIGVDFRLQRGVTVRGRVISAVGTAVSGALVQCKSITGNRSVSMYERHGAVTNERGEFHFGFKEKHRGYVGVFRVQSAQHGTSSFPDVRVEPGEPIELKLSPPAVVHGVVRSTAGHAISGARLTFAGRKTEPLEGIKRDSSTPSFAGAVVARCDDRGRYAVEVDAGLEYRVAARIEGVESREEHTTLAPLKPGETRVHNATINGDVTIVQCRFIGTPSGEEIATRGGFYVTVFSEENWLMRESVFSDGKLVLPGGPEAYEFQARYRFNDMGAIGPRTASYELSPGERVDIEVPDPQYFSVWAVDQYGDPLAGAHVNIMTTTVANYATREQTGEGGQLPTPLAMPPECGGRVWLDKPGYAPAWGAIHKNQRPGTVHPVDVIRMVPGAGFEGDLVDADGNPRTNTPLDITVTDGAGQAWPLEARTDKSGHFTVVDTAPAGVVDIAIALRDGSPGWETQQQQLEANAITHLGAVTLE